MAAEDQAVHPVMEREREGEKEGARQSNKEKGGERAPLDDGKQRFPDPPTPRGIGCAICRISRKKTAESG